MRLSITVPVAALVLCATVLVAAWRERAQASPPAALTGMALLRAYACSRGESKVVLVKGIEDDFSPAGDEPAFLRPGLDNARWRSIGAGSYDQSGRDRHFVDSLRAPARIRNGLFVIGLKPLAVADNGNDGISISDNTSTSRFSAFIAEVPARSGWKREGALHYARLDGIMLNAPHPMRESSLLDLLRGGAQPQWVDVIVHDDTSVDFIGLAACVEPPPGKGTPLMTNNIQPAAGIVALTCHGGPADWPVCNPYVGDTPCETELPVACLLPGRNPAPSELVAAGLDAVWSGGDIALTEPVPAARFLDIAEVDAFCTARFGRDWRTLAPHDGFPNGGVSGRGQAPAVPVRAWVDHVNQPYATCWTR